MKGTLPYVYFRGEVVPAEEAKISIASHSLQYGMTCFGGFRGYFREGRIRVFRLADHYERLMNAARILGMNYYMPYDDFRAVIARLIHANRSEGNVYFRPFIYSDTQRLAPKMPGLTFDLAIYMVNLEQYFDPSHGLKLSISSWQKFSDNALPTKAKAGGCYVNSSMATTDAIRNGYDDALMLDPEGYLVEGSVSNLVIVYRGQVIMPPRGQALLEGITMRTVVEFLKEASWPFTFEPIDRSMIYTADEVIMIGTAVQFSFVASIDGRLIGPLAQVAGGAETGPGPVCQLLREKFSQVLSGTHPKSKEWLTTFDLLG